MYKNVWNNAQRSVLTLFVILMCIYMSNLDTFQHVDATGNIYLAKNVIRNQGLTFTPENYPFMFTTRDNGEVIPLYYLTRIQGNGGQSEFINRFGIGTGLVLTPVLFVLDQFSSGDLDNHHTLWLTAKIVAAALTAGSAVLVYLIALIHVPQRNAIIICIVYALATSAWSYNSQSLFQHTACNFFLLLGIYLLYKTDIPIWKLVTGSLAMAFAAWCRPTCLVFILFSGFYFYFYRSDQFKAFFVINLVSIMFMAVYNYSCTGLPWSFPQIHNTDSIVLKKTGETHLWQTSIISSLAGILFSPARGLFFYTPVFFYSLCGVFSIFRKPDYSWLRYLAAAAGLILLVDASWFDWWGGWAYGYRLIMETIPVFSLLLIPVIDQVMSHKMYRSIFILLLAWSVAIQFIGAFAYDIEGWNLKVTYEIQEKSGNRSYFVSKYDAGNFYVDPENISEYRIHTFNIDTPAHRHRLWSLTDNPVSFYLQHFREARRTKNKQAYDYLEAISHVRDNPSSRGLKNAASK